MIQAAGVVQRKGYSWYPRGRQQLNLIFGAETRSTFIRQSTPLSKCKECDRKVNLNDIISVLLSRLFNDAGNRRS